MHMFKARNPLPDGKKASVLCVELTEPDALRFRLIYTSVDTDFPNPASRDCGGEFYGQSSGIEGCVSRSGRCS